MDISFYESEESSRVDVLDSNYTIMGRLTPRNSYAAGKYEVDEVARI